MMWVYKAQEGQSECPGWDRVAGKITRSNGVLTRS